MKHIYFPLITAALLIFVLSACEFEPEYIRNGEISFPDITAEELTRGGEKGILDFGGVDVGEAGAQPLIIKNTGGGDLVINSIRFNNSYFDFYEHRSPVFPITIKPGKSSDLVTLAFYPLANGVLYGAVYISYGSGDEVFINLTGAGQWRLTVVNNNHGTLFNGEGAVTISSTSGLSDPVVAPHSESDVGVDYTTISGAIAISAKPDSYNFNFVRWDVTSFDAPKGTGPTFGDQEEPDPALTVYKKAMDTIITLHGHTTIYSRFKEAYKVVSTNNVLQAAIDDVYDSLLTPDPDDDYLGVVIRGSVSNNRSVTLKDGVRLLGGFSTDWQSRSYEVPITNADDSSRTSRIDFGNNGGVIINSGGNATMIEGVRIYGSEPLRISGNANPIIRHSSFHASGTNPAIRISGASPTINNNHIYGGSGNTGSVAVDITRCNPTLQKNRITAGTSSAAYSETRGIMVAGPALPNFFGNIITGGAASGTASEYFGMSFDFECEPLIVGNTISGGGATGSGGKTTGIYAVNNGFLTLRYNEISGGSGSAESRALYSAHGTNYFLTENNITTGGGGRRYGIYLGSQGRVRLLLNNGFTNVDQGYIYTYNTDEAITGISSLNDQWLFTSEGNKDSLIEFPEFDYITQQRERH